MWTLIVRDHGRFQYLNPCIRSIDQKIGLDFFDRLILSEDGVELDMTDQRWEVLSTGPDRQGLTANLAQAWGALTPDDEWVFDVEADFLIRDAPLDEMSATLDAFPNVANMVLVRQPWNAQEQRFGSVLPTIPGLEDRGGWLEHRRGFWLNPFVAHASLLRSLQPGVETSLTKQCLARRLTFGYWGGRGDDPRCEHIGAEGGMGSPGWRP